MTGPRNKCGVTIVDLDCRVALRTPRNDVKAMFLATLFFAMLGSFSALANDKPDITKLRVDAEKGDAKAEIELSGLYYHGSGGVQQNLQKAVIWLRKAAEQGDAGAAYGLGVWYHNGEGVPKDYVQSYKWLFLAATLSGGAMDVKAHINDLSNSMTKDQVNEAVKEIEKWLEQHSNKPKSGSSQPHITKLDLNITQIRAAAEKGDAQAQIDLGSNYFLGNGVSKDDIQAYMWFSIAIAQNNMFANQWKWTRDNRIGKFMTPSQIAEAKRLADEWTKQHPKNTN